jgi:hypothetical protein
VDSSEAGCKIYCARPGSRLWEVDVHGNVISTQQLKVLLDDQPATKIVCLRFFALTFINHKTCVFFHKLVLFEIGTEPVLSLLYALPNVLISILMSTWVHANEIVFATKERRLITACLRAMESFSQLNVSSAF